VLYKHVNSWGPTLCLRLAEAGYFAQDDKGVRGSFAQNDPIRVDNTLSNGAGGGHFTIFGLRLRIEILSVQSIPRPDFQGPDF